MKSNSILVVVIIGILILFFFPNPEENFFAYAGTALFFTGLILFLIVRNRQKKN
jgi:FtsH-binding integral membrane protein